MKTTCNFLDGKKMFAFYLIFLINRTLNAQETSFFSKNIFGGISKDGNSGFLIIGVIIGFGICGYIIVSIIEKYRKKEPENSENTHHHIHHKHHHRKRFMKK